MQAVLQRLDNGVRHYLSSALPKHTYVSPEAGECVLSVVVLGHRLGRLVNLCRSEALRRGFVDQSADKFDVRRRRGLDCLGQLPGEYFIFLRDTMK